MTRNRVNGLAAAVALCIGALPVALQAQSQCAAPGAARSLTETEQILSAERGAVATLAFSTRYAGVTVSIEGLLCDPHGRPVPGTEIRLIRYSVDQNVRDDSRDGRPSAQDLVQSSGTPFSVLGTRRAVTDADGRFRFVAVNPGNLALEVEWDRVPDHPFVTWNVTWGPGPVMAAGRDFP